MNRLERTKEGNQIHLLDIVESDEPDVVETIETDRRTREVLALVPEAAFRQGALYHRKPVRSLCPVNR